MKLNLRKFRLWLLLYVLFDLYIGGHNGGFLQLGEMAAAQFTQVSGTVVDANGMPYAQGTITATLILSGVTPTLNGGSFSMTGTAGLDNTGSFVMQLADNNVMVPSGLKWQFQVCSAIGTILPAGGTGPQCFTPASITITGTTQSISTQLQATTLFLSISMGRTYFSQNSLLTGHSIVSSVGAGFTTQQSLGEIATALSGRDVGFIASMTAQPTANSSAQFYGISSSVEANSTFNLTGAVRAMQAFADTTGSGTVSQIDGYEGDAESHGTNTVASEAGFHVLGIGNFNAGGTVTTAIQFSAIQPVTTGLVSHARVLNCPLGLSTVTANNPDGWCLFDSDPTNKDQLGLLFSAQRCTSSASPAVCTGSTAGFVAVPAAGTTLTVNTTAVTATSEITLTWDSSLGTALGVTCNTVAVTTIPQVTARTPGTSFQITVGTLAANPACISYTIKD
jgi:hypothetical protein